MRSAASEGSSPSSFVFLHGGPGLCSAPDRAILGERLRARGHSCVFWDEPSRLRPSGGPFDPKRAYERWLASAERCVRGASEDEAVWLLTHSFAVQAGLELCRRHSERIRGLVAITPVVDALETYRSMLRLAERDFRSLGDERAEAIAARLRTTTRVMDEPMQQALALAAEDSGLLDHYWVSTAAQQRAMEAHGDAAVIDAESFFAVLCDFGDRCDTLHTDGPVSQPVLAVFGERDPVTPLVAQLPALQAVAPRTEAVTMPSTGHFVHLEAPDLVIDAVEDWIARALSPLPRS